MAVMGPDGRIYFGRSDVYAIDVLAPEGRKITTFSRDVMALPYRTKAYSLHKDDDGFLSIKRYSYDLR